MILFKGRVIIGLGLFIVIIGLILPAPLLSAATNEGIGGRPANPDPKNPRSQSIFVYTVENGKSRQDGVRVLNNTNERKKIRVYSVDGVVSSGGAFACAQRADAKEDVGQWIELDKNQLTLDAQSSEIVDFTLLVPEDASVGEHNGCIAIEEIDQRPQADENGVALSFRSALRVAVTVPGEIVKGLELSSLSVSNKDDDIIVATPTFENTGNVSLDTNVKARLMSLFGLVTIEQEEGGFPVLANNTAEFNMELDKPFWGGVYQVQASGTFNPDPDSGLGEEGQKETVNSESVLVFAAPEPIALLIELLVLAAIAGGIWHFVYRRREQAMQEHWESFSVEKGDSLESLSKDHKTSWKKIASVNKLKPPYALKPGENILLPNPDSPGKKHKSKKKRK